MADLTGILKVLGDPTRLRILSLLQGQELSVGELGRSLGMAQSRVSNHLRVLREAQLLRERRAGTSTYLRSALDPDAANGHPNGHSRLADELWGPLQRAVGELPEHGLDRSRLGEVLAERHERGPEFFDRIAREWDEIGERFRSGQARQRAAASLLTPGLTVADLGCGTGYFAEALVGLVEHLILVDASPGMLEQAMQRLQDRSEATRTESRVGELDCLPIADAELDGVVAGMVLHHLPGLDAPLREMRRVLRPGGRAVVLDLAPHRECWMHAALGDRHLGLEPAAIAAAFERAGFEDVRLESLDDRYCPTPPEADETGADAAQAVALPLYVVRGRVPSRTRRATD